VKASVVVPAYNARRQLERLLSSLVHSRLDPADAIEVVVVDDGSTDRSDEVVATFVDRLDVRYVFRPRTAASGRAAARNAGIAEATGDVVVMVDADQVVEPAFVAEHLRYHGIRADLVVIGPRQELSPGDYDDRRLAAGFTLAAMPAVVARDDREQILAEFSQNLNNVQTCWHYLFSCNASVGTEHLRAVGGFDEEFRGWGLEDSELGYRLRRRGLAFAFNPAAVAYHEHRHVVGAMVDEWWSNLRHMVHRHDHAPEVAAQAVIRRAFDPADRSLDWLECMRRFEYAARAFAGRTTGPAAYELIEVDHDNVAEALHRLAERARVADLLVIDDTGDARLSGVVQCLDTDRELLYFHRPAAAVRGRIFDRYPVVGRDRAGAPTAR
jgi:GT2 family glycosyltransferase